MQVSPLIASSGQPEKGQFSFIAEAGYQAVINLAMPDSNGAISNEGDIVESLGMCYVHIPVPFDSPTVDHLKIFFQHLQLFSKQKLWVHCVLNYRVSGFLYLYKKLVKGEAEEEARKVMWPSWRPDNTWKEFLRTSEIELQYPSILSVTKSSD